MNKRELQRLAAKVARAGGVLVAGTRRYGRGSYALDCVDTRTGIPFTLYRPEDWEEREQEAGALNGLGETEAKDASNQ